MILFIVLFKHTYVDYSLEVTKVDGSDLVTITGTSSVTEDQKIAISGAVGISHEYFKKDLLNKPFPSTLLHHSPLLKTLWKRKGYKIMTI